MMGQTIKKIILAEDNNEHYINFVQAVNKISQYIDVMRVENGYDLLSLLEASESPDVIFLDIDMPYKGGFQILEELQESNQQKKVPVVILSGTSYDLAVKVAHKLGAILYIKKYNRTEDLHTALVTLFSNHYFLSGTQAPIAEFVL